MEIRPARPEEHVVAHDVLDAAFGADDGVGALWDDVRGRGLARSELVAVDGDEIVGHVGLSHAWLDTRRALVDVLALGPLGVRPDRQRRGAGTALVAAAVAAAAQSGAPLVFLEGSPSYYGQRGFSAGHLLGFDSPSPRIPAAAFQVAVLPGHEEWMTGRLVYRDVWWEHDAVGLRDPRLATEEARWSTGPSTPPT